MWTQHKLKWVMSLFISPMMLCIFTRSVGLTISGDPLLQIDQRIMHLDMKFNKKYYFSTIILEWTLQSLLPYFCRINKLELKLSEMRSNFVTIHTGRINQTSDDWRFISKESIFCQPFFLLIFNEGVNFQCICMVYIWHNKQQSHTDWFFLCEMNRSSVRDSLYGRIINCFS